MTALPGVRARWRVQFGREVEEFMYRIVRAVLVGVSIPLVVATSVAVASSPPGPVNSGISSVQTPGAPDVVWAAPPSLAPLVGKLKPAVLNVQVKRQLTATTQEIPDWAKQFFGEMQQTPRMVSGEGTGFFISPDGYLLTNNHVIAGATEVEVTLAEGQHWKARVVGKDDRTDVALLKVDAAEPVAYVELGSSAAAEVGDWAMAIGNPYGLGHTVTLGIVSAKGRIIGAGPYDDFLQTDAPINPGNSGGPLFDMNGKVVGINTAIIGQGIAFSIPIDQVRPMLDDLKSKGSVSRGWLGLSLVDVPSDMADTMGASEGGVGVAQVTAGTPGEKAGLRAGDIVTSLDGTPVDAADDIVRTIGGHKPGDKVKLAFVRDGKSRSVDVTFAERPAEDALVRAPAGGSGEAARGEVQLDGLTVRGVEPGSRYERRLLSDDALRSIDGKPVKDGATATKLLAEPGGHRILVNRDGKDVFVIVPE